MFIDGYAAGVFVLVFVLSFGFYSGEKQLAMRLEKAAGLSFYLSITAALIWLVRGLADLSDLERFGATVAFSLLLMLYCSAAKAITLLVARFAVTSK